MRLRNGHRAGGCLRALRALFVGVGPRRARPRAPLGVFIAVVCLSASAALAPRAHGESLTFGKTSVGGSKEVFAAERKRVSEYSLPAPGAVSQLSIYLEPGSSSGQQVMEGVIYGDSNGAPGALLGVSSPYTYASTQPAGWYKLLFPAAVGLSAGNYWIGVITGASWWVAGYRFDSATSAKAYNQNRFAAGPSDPFGPFATDNQQMSLYATYAPALPENLSPPLIYGTPQQQHLQVERHGSWTNEPTSFAYQWLQCDALSGCLPIAGAKSSLYVPVAGDVGHTLRVQETASNAAGAGAPAVSAPTATVLPLAPTTTCPRWLQVSGSQIVAAGTNQPVLLRGANIMEAEWRNNVEWESKAIPSLASNWGGNLVVHGFASSPVNAGDANYLHWLDEYVALTAASHEYLIFSWRSDEQNGPQVAKYPDASAESALATLAARYRGDSHVMFELMVEPHEVAWSTVVPIYERMIDAIRRAAAPYNPLILVPGVEWGKDISGAISEPVKRSDIAYTSHPYTNSLYFPQYFGSAYNAGLPVLITEFAPTEYLSLAGIEVLLAYTRERGIGWAAWGFEPDAHPPLIESSLNPTNPFGATVRTAMLTTPQISGC